MKRLLIGIALVVSSAAATAQSPSLAAAAAKAAKGLPRGCIVTGEWRDGKASYGVSGPDKPAKVPAQKIVFEIGSISKTFTGLLLAQAVLEKKLRFETTLKQALDAKQAFADAKVAAITLAQLATHTSGLPRMPDNADFSIADPYGTYDTKKLGEWIASVKLEKAGPHDLSYSNAGVALLGHAIERALGDSWANLVRDRICKPLGMHDTIPVPTAEMRQRLVPPFDGKAEAHEWTFKAFAPAGGLRSTAADLMLFGRALNHPEASPLKESIQLAVKPLAEGIGCCFFLGEDLIAHNGGTGGYRTLLQARPKADKIRIVLINNAEMEPSEVMRPLDPG
jgi:D-alanyl-D-alanine-carboxypeptidase/D-alanyl-D-alanine-endopeptidase